MLTILNNKLSNQKILYLLIIINAFAIFIAGIVFPPMNILVGLVFGLYIYRLTYSVPTLNILWAEIRLFLVAFLGTTVGSLVLKMFCVYPIRPVCFPNEIKAQLIGNYLFSFGPLLIYWLGIRLPRILKAKRNIA